MSAIGPGDWVECLLSEAMRNPDPRITVTPAWPVAGGLYRVRDLGSYRTNDGALHDGLRLVGIVGSQPGYPDAWWNLNYFRPIYRPNAELIASLLAPAPSVPAPLVPA